MSIFDFCCPPEGVKPCLECGKPAKDGFPWCPDHCAIFDRQVQNQGPISQDSEYRDWLDSWDESHEVEQ